MKIEDIKQGQTIKLAENPMVSEDNQVFVEIEVEETSIENKRQKMK